MYIHPIKSLRPVPVSSATLTVNGLRYDRRFMLLRRGDDDGGWLNMHLARIFSLALFSTVTIS